MREGDYVANTRVKITPAAAAHKCLGENRLRRSGGSRGQRLCAEVFIVMQESRSPAYINSYVKWPFRFDNLPETEVMDGLCVAVTPSCL